MPRPRSGVALLTLVFSLALVMMVPPTSTAQGLVGHAAPSTSVRSTVTPAAQASPASSSQFCNGVAPNWQQRAHLTTSGCVTPTTLCVPGSNQCTAGRPDAANITLWVNATGQVAKSVSYQYVQVVFVVETTLFDGVYDPTAGDYGGGANGQSPCGGPCRESNGVPFLVNNIQQIAQGISLRNTGAVSNPHVTFSMVDYFSTVGQDHDDRDGSEYNVDVSTFQQATQFATTVTGMANAVWPNPTLFGGNWIQASMNYGDSDYSDNFLSSSMITALYGALHGSGLGWISNATTNHVIILMDSTLPRDPNYVGDWCPTYNDYAGGCPDPSQSSEPGYTYGSGLSEPAGETIADIINLAVSEKVLIDVINLPDGMTEAGSRDYVQNGYQTTDAYKILSAGCNLAASTGGSWEGPWSSDTGIGFTCSAAPKGNGGSGNLSNTMRTPSNLNDQWANDPSLGWALTNLNFPPITSINGVAGQFVKGANFEYVPPASGGTLLFTFASGVSPTYYCYRNLTKQVVSGACAALAYTGLNFGGFGWGWPYNNMTPGDVWSVTFTLLVNPSFPSSLFKTQVSIDACANTNTWVNGESSLCTLPPSSVSFGPAYSAVIYQPPSSSSYNDTSLPPLGVDVWGGVFVPPPPPPPPPGMPVINPIGVVNPVGVNVPIMSPVTQPVTLSVSQPTLVGQIVATPVGSPLVTAGFIGVFGAMGIATKVKQKKMVAVHSQAHRSGAGSSASPSGEPAVIGTME